MLSTQESNNMVIKRIEDIFLKKIDSDKKLLLTQKYFGHNLLRTDYILTRYFRNIMSTIVSKRIQELSQLSTDDQINFVVDVIMEIDFSKFVYFSFYSENSKGDRFNVTDCVSIYECLLRLSIHLYASGYLGMTDERVETNFPYAMAKHYSLEKEYRSTRSYVGYTFHSVSKEEFDAMNEEYSTLLDKLSKK